MPRHRLAKMAADKEPTAEEKIERKSLGMDKFVENRRVAY